MISNQIIIYQTQGGETKILAPQATSRLEVRLSEETVWLTADQMAELFQRNKSTISRHIKNIHEGGELQSDSVVAENATTAADGNRTVAKNATVQSNIKNNSTCAENAQVESGNIL